MQKRLASLLITSLCLFIFSTSRGQTMLLNVDRASDSLKSTRGPNLRRFTHAFIGIACVAGSDRHGARIDYGTSVDFSLGLRKKYKAGAVYSYGWELQADHRIFKLKQNRGKILPDTSINKIERMEFSTLGLGIFSRINFDPGRGNCLGTYLDAGICGNWIFDARDIKKNTLFDGSQSKSIIKNLPYVTDMTANLFMRFAHNKIAIFVSWQLTNNFRPAYHLPELPKIAVGIDLALIE